MPGPAGQPPHRKMRQRGPGVLRLAVRLASQRLEFVRRQRRYIRVFGRYDPPQQRDCNFDGRGRGGEEPGKAERRWRRVLRMPRRARGGERAAHGLFGFELRSAGDGPPEGALMMDDGLVELD
jgi:hypothetical protein